MSTPKTSRYICDSFSNLSDDEIRQKINEYIEKNFFDDILEFKVKDVLSQLNESNGICIEMYPKDTKNRLNELDGEQKVLVYKCLRNGWGCTYINNPIIEIL